MHSGMHLLVYLVHSGMHSCTIAPGVLHKCSMAHITLTDMHFNQLGAIAQLEKELSKDWFACSVGLNNKQALKVGSN